MLVHSTQKLFHTFRVFVKIWPRWLIKENSVTLQTFPLTLFYSRSSELQICRQRSGRILRPRHKGIHLFAPICRLAQMSLFIFNAARRARESLKRLRGLVLHKLTLTERRQEPLLSQSVRLGNYPRALNAPVAEKPSMDPSA